MITERTVGVVVLAVDVAGDRAADRDEPGAGSDRYEAAAWNEDREQIVDAHTAATRDRARVVVDDDPVVGWRQAQHVPAGVLGRIAVRAAEPACDATTVGERLDRVGNVLLTDIDQLGGAGGGAAPAAQESATP